MSPRSGEHLPAAAQARGGAGVPAASLSEPGPQQLGPDKSVAKALIEHEEYMKNIKKIKKRRFIEDKLKIKVDVVDPARIEVH